LQVAKVKQLVVSRGFLTCGHNLKENFNFQIRAGSSNRASALISLSGRQPPTCGSDMGKTPHGIRQCHLRIVSP